MAGLCPGHPRLRRVSKKGVDARNKCGHDVQMEQRVFLLLSSRASGAAARPGIH